MGYRSHGYLVFPSVYRLLYQKMCPETTFSEWDSDTDYKGYTVLSFSGWKWYGSYADISQLESFMEKLQEFYYHWEFESTAEIRSGRDKELYERIGKLPFEEMVTIAPWFLPKLNDKPVGTINMHKFDDYKPQDWTWGFNMQGEDTDDYTEKGHMSDLGGYNNGEVSNMWWYDDGGQAWKYNFTSAEDRDYFANNFDKLDFPMKIDILDHDERFEITIHSSSTSELWDQSNNRVGTNLSDPKKSFAFDRNQYDELAFAIWDEYEILKSQGDIYEMDIYENRSAEFDRNDWYAIELPEGYLAAVEKEYESP